MARDWRARLSSTCKAGAWSRVPLERRDGVDETSCQVVVTGPLNGASLVVVVQASNLADVAEAGWRELATLSFATSGVAWAGDDATLLLGTFAFLRLKVSHSGGAAADGANVVAYLCGRET